MVLSTVIASLALTGSPQSLSPQQSRLASADLISDDTLQSEAQRPNGGGFEHFKYRKFNKTVFNSLNIFFLCSRDFFSPEPSNDTYGRTDYKSRAIKASRIQIYRVCGLPYRHS